MNFPRGKFERTFDENCACFPRKRKTPEFTKKGEIHALFVSAPFLVWFAGATPDCSIREVSNGVGADGVGVKFPMVFANCSLCSCAKDKSERKIWESPSTITIMNCTSRWTSG